MHQPSRLESGLVGKNSLKMFPALIDEGQERKSILKSTFVKVDGTSAVSTKSFELHISHEKSSKNFPENFEHLFRGSAKIRKISSKKEEQFQKNPRAHKNKIGTPPPPPKKTPPKRGNFMDKGFPAERTHFFQASIKLAQPFPAPELRTRILRARGFF